MKLTPEIVKAANKRVDEIALRIISGLSEKQKHDFGACLFLYLSILSCISLQQPPSSTAFSRTYYLRIAHPL